jgi:hypothetical protein
MCCFNRVACSYHNDKKTRLEGAEINKSLLALKEYAVSCMKLFGSNGHDSDASARWTWTLATRRSGAAS